MTTKSRAAIPDDMDDHIERSSRTFMVTRRKDGSPTCHPMARFYADRQYYMNMYATSLKHHNLERDPHVCCLVTTNSDDPEFQAVQIRDKPASSRPRRRWPTTPRPASSRPGA